MAGPTGPTVGLCLDTPSPLAQAAVAALAGRPVAAAPPRPSAGGRILPGMPTVPDKPTLDGIEGRWAERWEADGVYRFVRDRLTRSQVFSIDTPPPTVSGSIHMGTIFGYTQTDALAWFQRMRGRGRLLPDRLGRQRLGDRAPGAELLRGGAAIRPSRTSPASRARPGDSPADHQAVPISRPNFVELCHELTAIDEAAFEALFRRLGLSIDWSLLYTTINDLSRRTSQVAFLRNLARDEAYSAEAPTVWDVDDRTAVAQAEIEDRERPGAYHLIAFDGPDGEVLVDSTRPELVVSCVALVTHPDDERHRPLVGIHRAAHRCSASRCRSSAIHWPSRTRAPASPWSARSATRPT